MCTWSGAVTSGMDLHIEILASDSKRIAFNGIHSEACETEMSSGEDLPMHSPVVLSSDRSHILKSPPPPSPLAPLVKFIK